MTILRGDFVPELRPDLVRRTLGTECVAWSPIAAQPVVLDPIATVILDVLDGTVSIGELTTEVHEEIGVPFEAAERQVNRVVDQFAGAGLLVVSTATSIAVDAIESRDVFLGGSTPCSESASRIGTVNHVGEVAIIRLNILFSFLRLGV